MHYLYLALAVITSGMSGVFYKKTSLASGNRATSILLPALWYSPLVIVFGIWALLTGGINCDFSIIWTALLAGMACTACAFALIESMKSNSYTLAIIIVNLSFVFPIILSMIFLGESAHLLQLIGMILAIAVVLLLNVGKGGGKNSVAAIIFALLSSLGNGTVDFAIKIQQYKMPGQGENSFFFFTYLFATILCVVIFLVLRVFGVKADIVKEHRRTLLFNAPGIAACNGICFLAISLLADEMSAAAQFTVITTLSIAVSLIVGGIRMKEKFGTREIISLVFCALAIACQYLNLI